MTTIKIYRNKRNENKFIEVHNDGYHHNSLKQYMLWIIDGMTVKNLTGDRNLHRWRKANLDELLDDYEVIRNLK